MTINSPILHYEASLPSPRTILLNMHLGNKETRGYMIILTQRKSTLSFLFIFANSLPISLWIIFIIHTVLHSDQEINPRFPVLGC